MKTKSILLLLALVVSLASCQKSGLLAQKTTYELVGEAKVVPGNYGNVVKGADVVTTATLLQTVETAGTFTGKVSGNIKEVCTNKGCWFAMELPNGSKMRVTFKDYGFFIPTNSQGFPITIEGVATLTETDVETLRHYAEDQGKSKEEVEAINAPKKEQAVFITLYCLFRRVYLAFYWYVARTCQEQNGSMFYKKNNQYTLPILRFNTFHFVFD